MIEQSIRPFAIKSNWQIQIRCGRGLGGRRSPRWVKCGCREVVNRFAVVTKEVELKRATTPDFREPIPCDAGANSRQLERSHRPRCRPKTPPPNGGEAVPSLGD